MLDALTGWLKRPGDGRPIDRPDPRPEDTADVLDFGDRCHVLRQWRRRAVLRYVHEHGTVRLRDLADEVACEEYGTDYGLLSSSQRKRVYVSLYQTHLPTLDDFDAIEFDSDRGTVAPGPALGELVAMLPTDEPR